MTNAAVNVLQGNLDVGNGQSVPLLGYLAWWNVNSVETTKDWLKAKLDEVGLDGERYARLHNHRATIIRCLRNLEDQRIIRPVTEDGDRMVYQFTAEALDNTDPDNPRLTYTPECVVEIDKSIYYTDDFAGALTKCDEKIRPALVAMYDKERRTYRSSDLTRYVQKIFTDQGDILSLRPQGSVYFVPAGYATLLEQVRTVLAAIPTGTAVLECAPIPDVASARAMVGHGVEAEIAEMFAKMEGEIKQMEAGEKITDKWIEHRQGRIKQIQDRIERYSAVLGDTAGKMHGQFNILAATLKKRALEI